MSRKSLLTAALLLTALVLLAACGAPAAEPAAEAAPTEQPAEEAVEEAAPAEADSEAAEPETAEAEATEPAAAESEAAAEAEAADGMRRFVVVSDQSTAAYLVDEEFLGGALDKLGIAAGAVDVVGSTQEVAGSFEIDPTTGTLGANEFTVQIDTLSTDQDRRDNWVRDREPAFGQFPVATFVADEIVDFPAEVNEGEEITFQLVGDLIARDTSVPATFNVTATLDGDTITGVAIADLLLSDFGINPPNFANTLVVEDPFQVRMELTAVEE